MRIILGVLCLCVAGACARQPREAVTSAIALCGAGYHDDMAAVLARKELTRGEYIRVYEAYLGCLKDGNTLELLGTPTPSASSS
ncbi:MAG: hypothetical protein R3B72_18710 [Polyangiaceae bacterium]